METKTNPKIEHHEVNIRENSFATDTKLLHLTTPVGKKVFKFSYESGNAFEHFKGEIFDGSKFNPVFVLTDLGLRNSSAYISTEDKVKQRISDLTTRGINFIFKLF